MKRNRAYWVRGEMASIARAAGIRPDRLSNILHRRVGVSWDYADKLDRASCEVLGMDARIPRVDWVSNRYTDHPAFFGEPADV